MLRCFFLIHYVRALCIADGCLIQSVLAFVRRTDRADRKAGRRCGERDRSGSGSRLDTHDLRADGFVVHDIGVVAGHNRASVGV